MRLLATTVLLLSCCSCAATSGQSDSILADGDAPGTRWTSRLIDPVSAPTTFESPVIHTSLNGIFMQHELPDDSIFDGGDVQIYALQGRYAVSDRLALIATKDGYIDLNPGTGADESGLADIAGGFKYAVIDDPDKGLLVTPGLIFETTSGDEEVFQGQGDGVLRPFVSAGWDRGELNVLGSLAYNLPLDKDAKSTSFDYHLHLDYEVSPKFFPLIEFNGITYIDDGDALAVDFEGGDLINLGSGDVSGNTLITGAVGARYRVNEALYLGFAYEVPLTSREDIIDSRVTVDLLYLF